MTKEEDAQLHKKEEERVTNLLKSVQSDREHNIKLRKMEEKCKALVLKSLNLLRDPEGFINHLQHIHVGIMNMDGTNIETRVALLILRQLTVNVRNKYSNWSENVLVMAGFENYIYNRFENRTENPWLFSWEIVPGDLVMRVIKRKAELLDFCSSCKGNHKYVKEFVKPRGEAPIYDCCIKNAYKEKFGDSMPEDFLLDIPSNTLPLLALRFLHYELFIHRGSDVSFETLRRAFFKAKKRFPVNIKKRVLDYVRPMLP